LDILSCTQCQGRNPKLKEDLHSQGEVKEGTLVCEHCGREYTITNYVPSFVRSEYYTNSFSYQWTSFPEYRYRLGAERGLERFHVSPSELCGKRILDAGCGSGRFSEFFSRCAADVYAFDLSNSVDEVIELCGLRPNIYILQAGREVGYLCVQQLIRVRNRSMQGERTAQRPLQKIHS
jgi:uncharacterized protein YbaR (Trm112 family)